MTTAGRVDRDDETKTGTKIAENRQRQRAKSDVRRSRAYYDQSQTLGSNRCAGTTHTCLNTRIVEARSSVFCFYLALVKFCLVLATEQFHQQVKGRLLAVLGFDRQHFLAHLKRELQLSFTLR